MYLIPLILIVVLALIAVAWTPVFALIIAVPLFLAFLVYVGMRRRSDETVEPPSAEPKTVESDTPKGAWGEPRP
jgi:dipeptide/tripeptide permease